ncbi:MAG: hypothetical protein GWN58_42705, partial [Anaerolineae bacterium]|nr:hypothetical protein [Anaerolineae bacterium]
FALAMHYVKQRRQRQQAQDHLQQVRLEGGISDQALLLLGWYHFDAQDYAATLPPWEELKRRNP